MKNQISVSYEVGDVIAGEALGLMQKAKDHSDFLQEKTYPYTGWINYADSLSEESIKRIEDTAEEISGRCKYLIVIGIGGSYLGAKAALSFINTPESKKEGSHPEVLFAGFNLSGVYHTELIEKIKDDDICLLVISKSGGTLEPGIAFATLKHLLIKKYGREEALSRVYAITDEKNGKLHDEAVENRYTTFVLPSDIGGRYSVLSPVGLLPIAVSGINIRAILEGAESAVSDDMMEEAIKFATVRATLEKEKSVEVIEVFEPFLEDFAGWCQQLLGESEGKEGRGTLPVSVSLSKDLHSLGQFLQEGKQIFYETILFVDEPTYDIKITGEEAGAYEGRSYSEFNRAALEGMVKAHRDINIPIIRISIPRTSSYYFGQIIYFAEMVCAISGMLIGINPFDQPGVEAYKNAMYEYLEKLK